MITLLGGSGYVGSAYRAYFEKNNIPYTSLSRTQVDYTVPGRLAAWLKQEKPDRLINAAGYTGKPNVDACENDKHNCLLGNAVLPGIVADACGEAGIPWGQISSGCIYTGAKPDGSGFSEADPPNFSFRTNNCSFYSGTKALGEEVLAENEDVWVWRLRIPFNHVDSPRNYLSKMMRYRKLLQATNSITHIDEFVSSTLTIMDRDLPKGIYNITNPGSVTTRDVTDLITEHGLDPHAFDFFDSEEDFMQEAAIAPRSNCVLDTTKLENAGIHLTPIREALHQALDQWISDPTD